MTEHKQPAAILAADTRDRLGEGPVWHGPEGALYWVDIGGSRLHRFDPASREVTTRILQEPLTCLSPLRSGEGFIGAFASGLARIDRDGRVTGWIARPEADRAGNRFNDGKSGPGGRFWAGSMNATGSGATGALYRVEPDGSWDRVLDGVGISNTFVWSLDGRTFYSADTAAGIIFAFDHDPDDGSIRHRRVLAGPEIAPGYPDGSALDAEGCLWNARWDGGCLVRITPDGKVDRTIPLPVRRPTSCAFGGPDLRTLYVTSAIWDFDEAALRDQPWAGGLLALEPGVQGAPVDLYGA